MIDSTATNQVVYDHRYFRSAGYQAVMLWEKNVTTRLDTGNNDTTLCVGSTSYVDGIESKHPGYLHYLYYYSTQTYGAKSSFQLFPPP